MFYLIAIWASAQAISLCFLPLTQKLFYSLPDKGYAFSKAAALVLFTYLVWLAGSLRLVKFDQSAILLLLIAIAIILWLTLKPVIRYDRRHLLATETIFLTVFLLTAYLKYRTAPIVGTEKPMDLAIISSLIRTDYFPPNDAWFAGQSVNYYYYGHYFIAFMAKLTTTPIGVIYTLALPLIFALTAVNIFGLVKNSSPAIKRASFFGLAAVTFTLFGGNLDSLVQSIRARLTPGNPIDVASWWHPSRVIGRGFLTGSDITITEFPYFSLLLGDVHAHVLALLFGSLFLAVSLTLYQKLSANFQTKTNLPLIVFTVLTLGTVALTNPWDLPGYALLSLLLLLHLISSHRNSSWLAKIKTTLSLSFLGAIGLFLFTLPFTKNFQMITPVNDPKPFIQLISRVGLIGRHTLWSEFMIIWGPLLVIFLITLAFFRKVNFPLLLCLTGLALIVFSEFLFFNDFFTAPLERMNTVFKLYYQAWLILGVGVFSFLSSVWPDVSPKLRPLLAPIIITLFLISLSYAVITTPSRLRDTPRSQWNLDGLSSRFAGSMIGEEEAAIVAWLEKNTTRQSIIVEAAIDQSGRSSYTEVGRLSAATGLSTILGWSATNHEGGWRNGSEEVDQRLADVAKIYTSDNLTEVKKLLNDYNVEYVVVGDLERRAYPTGDFTKFREIGELVFSEGDSSIYRVN